jgi:hypothetical protein
METLAAKALAKAIAQLGVQEVPKNSNSGPQVNAYLKRIGLGPGYAWCMAFVYWCVDEAANELKLKNPLVKTGGVMLQYNTTKLRKLPNRSKGIKAGDIFIMEFANGTGHTGIVEKVGKGLVYTIEGNTNDEGSRDGYEVARRERTISSIKGFIQLN